MIHFALTHRFPGKAPSFCLEIEYILNTGKCLGIYGPSGCGKSTLLRLISGLETPQSGFVQAFGKFWFDRLRGVNVRVQDRNLAFAFQDYALFPHLSVSKNLLYAHKDFEAVRTILETLRIGDLADRFPHELSGGQRQRVAIARALMRPVQLLLMDEPLSALDEELRQSLGQELRSLQKTLGYTSVVVSHSRSELELMCDEILELKNGTFDPQKNYF